MPENPTICKRCKHVDMTFDDNYRLWSCLVPHDQELNVVTGEMEPAKVFCLTKNTSGNCPDFEETDGE